MLCEQSSTSMFFVKIMLPQLNAMNFISTQDYIYTIYPFCLHTFLPYALVIPRPEVKRHQPVTQITFLYKQQRNEHFMNKDSFDNVISLFKCAYVNKGKLVY